MWCNVKLNQGHYTKWNEPGQTSSAGTWRMPSVSQGTCSQSAGVTRQHVMAISSPKQPKLPELILVISKGFTTAPAGMKDVSAASTPETPTSAAWEAIPKLSRGWCPAAAQVMGHCVTRKQIQEGDSHNQKQQRKTILFHLLALTWIVDTGLGRGRYTVHPFYSNTKLLQAVSHSKHSLTATAEFLRGPVQQEMYQQSSNAQLHFSPRVDKGCRKYKTKRGCII